MESLDYRSTAGAGLSPAIWVVEVEVEGLSPVMVKMKEVEEEQV